MSPTMSPEERRIKLRSLVRAYFAKRDKALHGCGDFTVYTRDEWAAKGETDACPEYDVHVAAEGAINEALNYDPTEYNRLVAWLGKHGLTFDQYYSWSWHFSYLETA